MGLIDVRVMAGERFNLLERGTVTSSSEDPLFLRNRLWDGRPSGDYRFASAGTDDTITVDGDLLGGLGNFEGADAIDPPGWTESNSGTGNCEIDTAQKNSGSSSLLMLAGTGFGQAYREFQARAGEWINISWAIRGDAGTGVAKVRVQNPRTGRYLTPGAAWTSTLTNLATQAAAAWATGNLTFQVEDFRTNLYQDPVLRVIVINDTGGSAWADDVYVTSGVDILTVHGHTIDPLIVPQFRSSTDNFAASDTLEGTATLDPPSFYVLLGARVYRRYWRLKLVGLNVSGPIQLGEMVIGQTTSLLVPYEYKPRLGRLRDRVATTADFGEQYVYPRARWSRRTLQLVSHYESLVQYRQAVDEIYERAAGDAHPIVIVPDTALPDVLFAKGDQKHEATRTLLTRYDEHSWTLTEMPFPSAES